MDNLPLVVRAEQKEGFLIDVSFSDGTSATVDFEDWLEGPIFEPLRNPASFSTFFIEAGAIVWPNGADIAPETLYERAKSTAAA